MKKHITVKQDKKELIGEWLMSVYEDKSFNVWGKVLHIYKTEQGIKRIETGNTAVSNRPLCYIFLCYNLCPAGSYAEAYAKENNIPFEAE